MINQNNVAQGSFTSSHAGRWLRLMPFALAASTLVFAACARTNGKAGIKALQADQKAVKKALVSSGQKAFGIQYDSVDPNNMMLAQSIQGLGSGIKKVSPTAKIDQSSKLQLRLVINGVDPVLDFEGPVNTSGGVFALVQSNATLTKFPEYTVSAHCVDTACSAYQLMVREADGDKVASMASAVASTDPSVSAGSATSAASPTSNAIHLAMFIFQNSKLMTDGSDGETAAMVAGPVTSASSSNVTAANLTNSSDASAVPAAATAASTDTIASANSDGSATRGRHDGSMIRYKLLWGAPLAASAQEAGSSYKTVKEALSQFKHTVSTSAPASPTGSAAASPADSTTSVNNDNLDSSAAQVLSNATPNGGSKDVSESNASATPPTTPAATTPATPAATTPATAAPTTPVAAQDAATPPTTPAAAPVTPAAKTPATAASTTPDPTAD